MSDQEVQEALRLQDEIDAEDRYFTFGSHRRWSRPLAYNWITDRIAVGDEDYLYDSKIQRAMKRDGVTHVLDCREETNRSDWFSWQGRPKHVGLANRNFCRLVNGCDDDGQDKSDAYWRISVEFGKAALENPDAKLYVHCAAGINRGPSNAYAIMRAIGYSELESVNLLKGGRPIVGILYQRNAERAIRRLGYVN